jgi:hypothetical protein
MSRLTKKNNQGTGSWTQFGDEYIPAHNVKHRQCVNKLGKLEDIEDELSCPLEVREKAFNDGFYDNEGNHYFCEHYVPSLKAMHTRGILTNTHKSFKLKDYKKTWWLKEDLSE